MMEAWAAFCETKTTLRAPGDRDQLFRLIATSRSD
jgi:hypothetical protein